MKKLTIKKLSIKARVTLWYTILIMVVIASVLAYVFIIAGRQLKGKSEEALGRVVLQNVQQLEFDGKELDDGSLSLYKEGVSIFIYDSKGRLLAPENTQGLKVNALLEDGQIKKVNTDGSDWLVYDVYTVVNEKGIWVRGVVLISELEATIQSMTILALIGGPFFLLVAAVGGFYITKRAFRPIQKIVDTADQISFGKDLTLRMGGQYNNSKDEVARLAKTFDKMFDRLQKSFEAEKQFTSDASHELRTPIAIIIAQCEYALDTKETSIENKEEINVILRQARKMSGLLSSLLMLARADDGRIQLMMEEVNISELTDVICEELGMAGNDLGVTIEPMIEKDVTLMADETLFMRLITNLISNAITYNKENGHVFVRILQKEGQCILEVEDNGIGIAKEHIEKIFNRFYRVDVSRNREGKGSGLGLAMVSWIVEVHGGRIEVISEPQTGSKFTVYLPLEK